MEGAAGVCRDGRRERTSGQVADNGSHPGAQRTYPDGLDPPYSGNLAEAWASPESLVAWAATRHYWKRSGMYCGQVPTKESVAQRRFASSPGSETHMLQSAVSGLLYRRVNSSQTAESGWRQY